MDDTSRLLRELKKQSGPVLTPIATDMFIPNHSGDHSAGRVLRTPTNSADIANKAYVDAQITALGLPLSHINASEITDVGTNTHSQIDTHISATLAGHAATTSAQLAGVISDETGSGALVFGTSPTIASPTITGVISNALGAVGAPSYTFTGDLDTGIYSEAANTVNIATAGVERVQIDTVFRFFGNLTLGTVTADTGFGMELGANSSGDRNCFIDFHSDDTYADNSLRIIRNAGENATSLIQHRGTGTFSIGAVDAASFALFTSNATRFSIDSTGIATFNIGIVPDLNDGAYLGSSTLGWSDLFLASGAVVNFNNGNATITHSAAVLTLAGADLKISSPGNVANSTATVDGTQTFTNKTHTTPKIGTASTGAGTASLSTNCPAVTVSAPYTWMIFKSSDGSTVYVPCWK